MIRNNYVRFGVLACACAGLAFPAEVRSDSSRQAWILKTGPVEYRLRQMDGAVRLEYFGPAGSAVWRMGPQRRGQPVPSQDISGTIGRQAATPEDLELKFAEPGSAPDGVETLRLRYQHRRLPLEIEAVYSARGDTGVISRKLKLTNRGSAVLHVESMPELSWRLPTGDYDLTYRWGGWGQEKQMAMENLGAGRRTLANLRGRSTSLYSPWFSLDNKTLGVRYGRAAAGYWQHSAPARRLDGFTRHGV